MGDNNPILSIAYSICFYLIFWLVPYILVFILRNRKLFAGTQLKTLFRLVLDLQVIFLFSFVLLIILPFLIFSIFTGNFFVGLEFIGLILTYIPVVLMNIIGHPILSIISFLHLLFQHEGTFILIPFIFCLVLLYVWFRLSLCSIKKVLSISNKKSFYLLSSLCIIILLLNLFGEQIINLLHSYYFYCFQNILCLRKI